MTERVATKALRAHAVRRSLFAPTTLPAAVDTLGFVQLDPIRAPARAADLILRHRVADYRVGDLDRAYPDLPLVEDYVHVYGVLPARTQRLLLPRGLGSWHIEREHPRLAARIVAHVRRHGITHPRDLHDELGRHTIDNDWGGTSAATTRMLEALQYRGKLRVARRESGIRLYDIAGPRSRARSPSARAKEVFLLLLRLYAPMPEASFRKVARMALRSSVAADEREAVLARLERSSAVRRAEIDGAVFLWPADEAIAVDTDERVRLLAPFDPVVWDRRRFGILWGWEYRFEAYTPPAKRKLGYYALPLLWRDDVIGWANAAVVDGTLEVTTGFAKARPRGATFRHALEAEVASLAAALGSSHFRIASGVGGP